VTASTLVDLESSTSTIESATGIDLDLDALERAAAEAQTPFFRQIQDLPPPPASVLGPKRSTTGSSYSVRPPAVSPGDSQTNRRSPPPGSVLAESSSHGPSAAGTAPPPPRPEPPRYAASRPAAIFATSRPQEGVSIFGEDLISEKSLDEVILGYLAEDLDVPSDKK